ncbi:beta-ketoacyl synthase N-terminal-like domain-containing protein [Saccharopolyspora sp. MS10]|uniref:beta-ketoacyl synthase N-terminal-like domain-containing protein n=1 Tax=Saccharopolyspora sp. MS10 TaxID=3385973 RepID=UPI0039A0F425
MTAVAANDHRAGGGELVLSAWSAVSPFGVGREAFAAGVTGGRPCVAELDERAGPFRRGGVIPDFVAAEQLGRKGTRSMDRVTAITVKTVGALLSECGPELTAEPDRLALTWGTGSGSAQSIMDFTRDSLTGAKPFHVDPARFPNTVMNRAAGQSAIWHSIKGPNTTIAGGALTGSLALRNGVRLVRGGHCDRVVFGASEEHTPQRSWLEWRAAGGGADGWVLGEGGAAFLLERAEAAAGAGRAALARVLGSRFRAFGEPDQAGRALAECVRGNLADTGARAGSVRVVAPLDDAGEWGERERGALDELVPDAERVRPRQLIGDTSAAAGAMQLAAVLAWAQARDPEPGDLALITGVERDGTVGSVLLALGGGS